MSHQTTFAKGRDWWITAEKPEGGYVIVRETAIQAAWLALQRNEIDLRSLRAWLACHEAVARRTASRSRRTPKYTIEEIHALVGGVGGEHVRRSLRQLDRAGLATFSEGRIELHAGAPGGRPIPVPRRLLRHLAKPHGRVYLATAFGHLIRCLYLKSGRCVSGGYCKASWIADTFSVALRAVKSARADLISGGYLSTLACDQHRLNRFGVPTVVVMTGLSTTRSAPRRPQSTTESALPNEHENLSCRRSEHQEPSPAPEEDGGRIRGRKPDLARVCADDLACPKRLVQLFVQAERKGWVSRCEADKLNFLAAAERAKRVATRNAPGLFVRLVHRRRFDVIAAADEDRARELLRRLRENGIGIARSPEHPVHAYADHRLSLPTRWQGFFSDASEGQGENVPTGTRRAA